MIRRNWIKNTLGLVVIWPFCRQWFAPKTTTMLTRDGRLVEVDRIQLPRISKKASVQDIQTWISKKADHEH